MTCPEIDLCIVSCVFDHIAAHKGLPVLSVPDSHDDQQIQCMDFTPNHTPVLKGMENNVQF